MGRFIFIASGSLVLLMCHNTLTQATPVIFKATIHICLMINAVLIYWSPCFAWNVLNTMCSLSGPTTKAGGWSMIPKIAVSTQQIEWTFLGFLGFFGNSFFFFFFGGIFVYLLEANVASTLFVIGILQMTIWHLIFSN